jgi:hypothetical protein
MPQKIFAVLVGIDQYQKYPLSGCVNDIKAVEQWLHKAYSDEGQLSVLRLTDEDLDNQPHRQHIIDAFNHFDKATGEDIPVLLLRPRHKSETSGRTGVRTGIAGPCV